jgi:hypothetical protein
LVVGFSNEKSVDVCEPPTRNTPAALTALAHWLASTVA